MATALMLTLALGGCDSTATIFKLRVSVQSIRVVDAWPAAQDADGNWERVCDVGTYDGIIADVAIKSNTRQSSTDAGAEDEHDVNIQPDDVVEFLRVDGTDPADIKLSGTQNIGLSFDCIDPVTNTAGNCAGASTAFTGGIDGLRYHEIVADRDTGHNILLLLDQSGSIGGLVDPTINNSETGGSFTPSPNFRQFASDPDNQRLAAAKTFLEKVDPEDRFGAIAFNEPREQWVPCTLATGDFAADLSNCFGKRNLESLWNPGGVDQGLDILNGKTNGRSNLWDTVEVAYDFLRDTVADRRRSNHIIVVTDGPDTCASSENLYSCQSPCNTTDYDDVVEKILADRADPNGIQIQVHFVQFEAPAYLGRDARQYEVACVSGGSYQFINSFVFPRQQSEPLRQALDLALDNVRTLLMGRWEVAAEVPAYIDPSTAPGGLYAIDGRLEINSASNLPVPKTVFPFDIGQGEGASEATQWDRRLTIRKPCGAATDCGATPGAGGGCNIICSNETKTCPGGATGITAPDRFACMTDAGASGSCCTGSCIPPGQSCTACN